MDTRELADTRPRLGGAETTELDVRSFLTRFAG